MKQTTIDNIQISLSALRKVVQTMITHHDSLDLKVVDIYLQNAALDTSNCQGYSIDNAIQHINTAVNCIKEMAEYSGKVHPIIQWIASQADMIVGGNILSEEYEISEEIYDIYHTLGDMNHDCQRNVFEYTHVANVKASSLDEAYQNAQNGISDTYDELAIRSTSIGDIIGLNAKYYIVMGIGFEEVPETVVSYINWSNR